MYRQIVGPRAVHYWFDSYECRPTPEEDALIDRLMMVVRDIQNGDSYQQLKLHLERKVQG